MDRSLSALSNWFPKLEGAGLPVPKTVMIEMSDSEMKAFYSVFDGSPLLMDKVEEFFSKMDGAIKSVREPCFLRTDHTSAKHSWKNTCYLDEGDILLNHIINIIEFSEMADMMGLPWRNWAVREYLPIIPYGVCPKYGDMPVCKEFRFFVDDGKIRCHHPYWPKKALEDGGLDLQGINFNHFYAISGPEPFDLAEASGKACPGSWSIDVLETKRGWFVTDMAVAGQSYHWKGCPCDPLNTPL